MIDRRSTNRFDIARATADCRLLRLLATLAVAIAVSALCEAPDALGASWSTPVVVANGDIGEPQVAVDADGDATAVWTETEGENLDPTILMGARRPAGGSWSTPVQIFGEGDEIGGELEEPRIAMAASGAATVVWLLSGEYEESKIMAAQSSADGTWSSPVELEFAKDDDGPQVSVSPDGAVLVAWEKFEQEYKLMSASRPAGGAWSSPSDVSSPLNYGEHIEAHQAAIDDAGAVIAWTQGLPGQEDVMAVSRSAAGSWSAPVDLGEGQVGYGAHSIAMDGTGDATVVWTSRGAESASHPAGGVWSSPLTISSGDSGLWVGRGPPNSNSWPAPVVAADGQGNVTAAWWATRWSEEEKKAEPMLGVASRSAGEGWSPAEEIAVPEADGFELEPDIVLDPSGDAVAVWSETVWFEGPSLEESGDECRLWSKSRAAGGAWSATAQVFAAPPGGTTCGLDPGTPVAIDQAGVASAVWSEGGTLYAATSGEAPAVAITGGPLGLVRSASATFTFGSGEPGVEYQCQLDSGGWQACSSPHQYSGLADGEHSFSVRTYDAAHHLAGQPATRTWTVDTMPPRTTITAGPSGRVEEAAVSFSFEANEQGATFACSLDGASFTPCSSPRAYEPGNGPHTFTVRATDAAGNAEANPPSRSFEVAGGAVCPVSFGRAGGAQAAASASRAPRRPGGARASGICGSETVSPPAECPAHAWPERGFGAFVVVAETRTACFHLKKDVYVSSGPVRVNGMLLTLPKGATLTLNYTRHTLETSASGQIKLASWMPEIPIGPLHWESFRPTFRLGLPFEHQLPISLFAQQVKMPKIELDSDNAGFGAGSGGATRIAMQVEVPALFGHPSLSELEGTAEVSNGNGFQWVGQFKDPQKIKLAGGLVFKDLTARLDSLQQSGTLGGTVVFPGGAEVSAEVGLTSAGVYTFKLAADDLNKPIGGGFFLQRLHIARGPNVNLTSHGRVTNETLSGGGGGSFGPQLAEDSWLAKVFQVRSLISLDGEVTLGAATVNNPWYIIASGAGKLLNMQIASGAVELQETGAVSVWGSYELGLWGWGTSFEVPRGEGWYDHASGAMQLRGIGHVRLPGFEGNGGDEVLVDNRELVACRTEDSHNREIPIGERTGFRFQWGGSFGRIDAACDLSKLAKTAPSAEASAAAVGGPRQVTVPKHTKLFEFQVEGEGAPPKVEVSGPHAERVSTPADGSGLEEGNFVLVQDQQAEATDVTVRDPGAGRWTIAAQSGSVPIAGVRIARGLPLPRVKGRISGCPRHCLLRYELRRIPGQQVVLYEVGAGASRSLGVLKKGSGSLPFKPLAGGTGKRRLVARVLQYGRPRAQLTLGRFHVSAPRPPAPRRMRLRRRHGGLLVASWAPVRRARGYAVTVRIGHRRPVSIDRRKARLVLSVGRRSRVTVTVWAIGAFRVGPGKTAHLR